MRVVAGDDVLLSLMRAVVAGDRVAVDGLLNTEPGLATAAIETGATRQDPDTFFIDAIRHHVYRGDTAVHIAAAAHSAALMRLLVERGARVDAVNRRGAQPLHYAVDGGADGPSRSAPAQRATVECLLELGAEPNARDKNGTTPLLRAIRNRCADAVEALLAGGADVRATNDRGSTARQLAEWTTGKGGSGSPEARAAQQRIIDLLTRAGGPASRGRR